MTTETINGQEVLRLHPTIYRGRLSRRPKGWRMLPGGVGCGRPGLLGNPFRVGDPYCETIQDCVDEYDAAIRGESHKDHSAWRRHVLSKLVARHREHGYIVLYCWCKLGDPCHCHPLADAVAKELERIVK